LHSQPAGGVAVSTNRVLPPVLGAWSVVAGVNGHHRTAPFEIDGNQMLLCPAGRLPHVRVPQRSGIPAKAFAALSVVT
jgi:hypothetical protein